MLGSRKGGCFEHNRQSLEPLDLSREHRGPIHARGTVELTSSKSPFESRRIDVRHAVQLASRVVRAHSIVVAAENLSGVHSVR